MPKNNVRFFDKISKKNINVKLSEEFKQQVLDAAGDFFPYPVIIKHEDHYTILHLDRDFNDRGTVQTEVLLDLDAIGDVSVTDKDENAENGAESDEIRMKNKNSMNSLDSLSNMTLDGIMEGSVGETDSEDDESEREKKK